jgi:hypothetical protein
MVKIFSIIIFTFSLVTICYGLYGLSKTNDIANFLDIEIHVFKHDESSYSHEFDSHDWKIHWISWIFYYILFGVLGLINSIGLMKKREWSRKLFLGQVTIGIIIEIFWYLSGLAKYTWESVTLLDLSIYAIIVFGSWLILCRKATRLEFNKYT